MKVPKTTKCNGCILEKESSHYVPDQILSDAPVFVLGETPLGAEDQKTLETIFFPLAGLVRGEKVSIGHTVRCQVHRKLKPTEWQQAAIHCKGAYEHIPEACRLVVGQGNSGWSHLTRHSGLSINDWRGHCAPYHYLEKPVYGVLNVTDLTPSRNPRMTLPSKLDWSRIPAILRGEYPKPLPPRLIVGECEWGEVLKWFQEAHEKASYLAWDTEFIWNKDDVRDVENYKMTMVSIAYPEMSQGIQLLWQGGEAAPWQKSQFIQLFWNLAQLVPHVGHNFTAELKCVQKTWGWLPSHFWGRFDDTMLAHAVLWSEFAHSLNFLESVYSPYPKIKHLPTTDPLRNWGDTCITMAVWEALKREFINDPESESVYP